MITGCFFTILCFLVINDVIWLFFMLVSLAIGKFDVFWENKSEILIGSIIWTAIVFPITIGLIRLENSSSDKK